VDNVLIKIVVFGFVIQQALEFADSLFQVFWEKKAKAQGKTAVAWAWKKPAMILFASSLGVIVAFSLEVQLLGDLGVDLGQKTDFFLTGLVISTGTEGYNTALKAVGHLKKK